MNYLLLLLVLSCSTLSAWAQTNNCQNIPWTSTAPAGTLSPSLVEVRLPAGIHQKVNYSVDETRIQFRLGLEENGVFPYGKGDSFALNITLTANIKDAAGNLLEAVNGTLQLSENKSEAIYQVVLNGLTYLESIDPYNLGTSTTLYVVDDITINYNFNGQTATPTWSYLQNTIQFTICQEMDIRSDVGGTSNGFTELQSTVLGLATQPMGMPYYQFEWAAESQVAGLLDRSTYVPHYEFQLLKLENTLLDAANRNDEKHIKTVVNWDNALSFVLPAKQVQYQGHYRLLFRPSEGTGYYLWRVRPMGNYFEGGVAQNQNWGAWSDPLYPVSNGILELQVPSSFDCFYYQDKDQNDNYLYNRLFTEDGQVYESMTYADKLLRPRQSQTYLPHDSTNAQGQTVVGQTLYDHLGRSSISVIPVPVDGYMNGYKKEFVTKDNGELYRLEDYGVDGTIYNPATISDTGAYQYYSENNTQDLTVPSAEGYPFTRTIYSNDGLNRVREQSGIGKQHMVGPRSAGRGRTTTTDVQVGVTDAELVSIFGLEAPHPDHVVKQVVTDPNGTNSVTYTSKSGKTLATALSEPYEPNNNDYPLLPLDQSNANEIRINETMGLGNLTAGVFVNTKTILLTQLVNTMTISYQAPGCSGAGDSDLPACLVSAFAGCNYTVELTVRGETTDSSVQAPYYFTEMQQVSGCNVYAFTSLSNLPAGTYSIEKRVSIDSNNLNTLINDYQGMVEGQMSNYMTLLEALLNQVNQPSDWARIDSAVTDVNLYLNSNRDAAAQVILAAALNSRFNNAFQNFDFTLLNAASGGFGEVVLGMTYEGGLDSLQTGFTDRELDQLLLVVQNCEGDSTDISTNITQLKIPFSFGQNAPYNYQPLAATLGDVAYDYPPFVEYFVDRVGGALYDSTQYTAILDSVFGGYQYWDFSTINTPQLRPIDGQFIVEYRLAALQNDTNKLKVLNANQFNRMVWHMLNDEYYLGQVRHENGLYEYYVDSTNTWLPYLADRASLETTQYTPDELTDCWKGLIGAYEEMVKQQDAFSFDSLDLDDLVDDSDGDFNDDLVRNIPWVIRFFFGNKLDDALQNTSTQNSSGVQPFDNIAVSPLHLPSQFLACTGTRYARLINQTTESAARTLATNTSVHSSANLAFNTYDVPLLGDNTSLRQSVSVASTGYVQGIYTVPGYSDEVAEYYGVGERLDFTVNMDQHTIAALPYVQNPVFAFKYYEYWVRPTGYPHPWDGEENSAGNQTLDLDDIDRPYSCIACEQTYAYEEDLDNNSCGYSTIGHDRWNAARRANFFNCILNISTTYPFPGNAAVIDDHTIRIDALCTSSTTYLQAQIDTMQADCQVACEERRAEFRREVIDMFERACWNIGDCTDNNNSYVSLAEIETVVDRMVLECRRQCDSSVLDVPTLVPASCTSTLPGMNTGLVVEYCDVPNLGVCLLRLQQIAKYWHLELYIDAPTGVVCPTNGWTAPQPDPTDAQDCVPVAGGAVDPNNNRTPVQQLIIPN